MEFCVVDGEATGWSQYLMPEVFLLQNVSTRAAGKAALQCQ